MKAVNLPTLVGCLLCSWNAWAQGIITTVAGAGFEFPREPLAATSAPVGAPVGVAIADNGDLYLSDTANSLVLKVDRRGILTIVAGNGTPGFSGDQGPATAASLNGPQGIAIDRSGNLYIADSNNHRIRIVTKAGTIATVAGDGAGQYSGDDGAATAASLCLPAGVAVDADGEVFIADFANGRIRKISADGIITTVAGNGESDEFSEGTIATRTPLRNANGIAVDTGHNLYISGDWPIRKVDSDGVTSSIAIPRQPLCSSISSAIGIGGTGDLFVTNPCGQVFRVSPSGDVVVVAGRGGVGFRGDGGPAVDALLKKPVGVTADDAGNVFIADTENSRVRRVTASGIITTIAGGGNFRFGGDGGAATGAYLSSPRGIAVSRNGDLYIADTQNNRVRRVNPGGAITTVAGTGVPAFWGDGGNAVDAALSLPYGVAVNSDGILFIADTVNSRTRKVTLSGTIDTVLGGATGVAVDAHDNLYVADASHAFRLTPAGASTRIAGSLDPAAGFSGDGGPAADAQFSGIRGMAADSEGNVFLADGWNNRVRKVDADGIVTTVAGTGESGYSGDGGPAVEASLSTPTDVAVDAAGNIYIADSENHRIRMVDKAGVITTIAGTGEAAFSGDGGISTAAGLNRPLGVALDSSGNLYISDSGNNRIRKVLLSPQ